MDLKPLGKRVLVRPDPPETATESGLVIPDRAQDRLAMSGTVVAVGPLCAGPSYRIKAGVLAVVERAIESVEGRTASRAWADELRADLRALLSRYYDQSADGLRPGMAVAFPYTVGTTIPSLMDLGIDGEHLILINEEDIVAAWDAATVTVETAA